MNVKKHEPILKKSIVVSNLLKESRTSLKPLTNAKIITDTKKITVNKCKINFIFYI